MILSSLIKFDLNKLQMTSDPFLFISRYVLPNRNSRAFAIAIIKLYTIISMYQVSECFPSWLNVSSLWTLITYLCQLFFVLWGFLQYYQHLQLSITDVCSRPSLLSRTACKNDILGCKLLKVECWQGARGSCSNTDSLRQQWIYHLHLRHSGEQGVESSADCLVSPVGKKQSVV